MTSPTRARKGSDHAIALGDGRENVSVKTRPSNVTLRRRSTLNWGNSSPMERQMKLEDVTRVRMADCWFSVHLEGLQEPIYISEIVRKSMNPGFRFFDLDIYGAGVTRQDELVIKVWARMEASEDWVLLTRLKACLGSLQFIGKSVRLGYSFILGKTDNGIYSLRVSFTRYRRIALYFTCQTAFTQASPIYHSTSLWYRVQHPSPKRSVPVFNQALHSMP